MSDLKSQFDTLPWLSLKTSKQDCLLMKYIVDDLFVKLIVCDLCNVYEETLSDVETLRRFKSLNKDIEIQGSVLMQEIQNIFCGLTNNTYVCDVSKQNDHLVLKTSTKLFGDIDVEWQSTLKRCTPEVFQKQFTIPLLALNRNLNSTVNDLKDIIIKKDKQINDYKSQRAKLIVKHFETLDFDEQKFMDNHCSKDYLQPSFDHCISNASDSCSKLANDRCFRNICENIYCEEEKQENNSSSVKVEPIDETQEELRKRKEIDEMLNNPKPSAMPRKKKLNL